MFTLKVLFKDNTTIEIENVKSFEIDCQFDMFFVELETHNVMIPRDTVKMIGRAEDFSKGLTSVYIDD